MSERPKRRRLILQTRIADQRQVIISPRNAVFAGYLPMLNTSFTPWPDFTDEEAQCAAAVVRSNKVNYWTGTEGREFEKEFAQWSEAEHAIVVANGTVALDLAWLALNISAGDEVIVTSRTFQASVSSIVLAGGIPVFADIDRDSQNITAATIAPLITPRTRAILCVHLAGWPCEMDAMRDLAEAHGLALVEDCAQAHGARYRNRSVGALGDIAAWSFCQDKIMTTAGEGGMVTTGNRDYWSRMWSYKDHGKSWESVYEQEHPPGFRWHHREFGTNWRLPEVQSAIGRIQLRRMADWTAQRQAHAARILDCAEQHAIFRVPRPPEHVEHAYYKCYLFVQPERFRSGWSRDRLVEEIVSAGVPCFSGSCSEVYLEQSFVNAGLSPAQRLPIARELGETSVMFLVHPTLTEHEISRTTDVLANVARSALR